MVRACERSVLGAENGAERAENRLELSGVERSGKRGSKNQVERERSGGGRSSERKRSGERTKSAAQNPLHHKTTQVNSSKSSLKVTKVYCYFLCCVENKSDYLAIKEYHFNYAALVSNSI